MNLKFIISLLLFFGIFIDAQKKQQIFFCSEIHNPTQQEFVRKNKVKNFYIFYQDYIIDRDLNLDKDKLKKEIDRQIPSTKASGYAALDVEAESLLIILKEKKVSINEYNRIINNHINMIRYAKSLRPNIKWSFYGYNLTSYPYVTDGHENDITVGTYPLLRELDFLAPSMYLQDKKTSENLDIIKTFVSSNLTLSLKLGKKFNKPVYPFVWNRYHNVSSENTLIDPSDFQWYVSQILNFTYNKRKVDGVIFWNSETYIYETNKNMNVRNEYRNVKDIKEYQTGVLQEYWNTIKNK
ncbi:hypothetical protein DRF65_07780 [Chryseobacterium pennae]|uniref:Hyaluronidase n=1 Tax=Chryseobacterium pennae TaxID=2258962 RepID=A0A3D9CBK4_9FLAO|nr:hypothetical protein [Chryseobacterium pennae]REC63114.1 hypothetical protein DRF65_07780 [Chryseobacterium pennae]